MSTPRLRPYQTRGVGELRKALAAGARSILFVLPTGGGKTVVFAEIIRSAVEKGKRVGVFVHRHELLAQTVSKLENVGVTNIRIIQAGSDLGSPNAPVFVASIPTLVRRKGELPQADLIIIDEAHHTPAKTWASLAGGYSRSIVIGFSATPQRADGKSLSDIFDSIVVGATPRELMDLGHLVECKVYAPHERLEKALALSPVEAYQQHGHGERAVIFCVSVKHATTVAEQMNAAGIPTGLIHGSLSRNERRNTLAALDAGTLRAVASCHVLTEGWDSPAVSICILARKPQHAGLYLQMVGRVLRPSPGKTHATLLDLCGSVHDHGPPDLEREYTLSGKGISKVDHEKIRQCVHCGGVFQVGPLTCPMCGVELPRRTSAPPESIGVGVVALTDIPRPPPRTVSMTAKYPGRCRLCTGRIAIGEAIYWAKGEKPRHASCAGVDAAREANRLMRAVM